MRASVIVSDLLTYIPSIVAFSLLTQVDEWRPLILFCLLNPALLLIDHGHFQFNGVALGLVVLAIALIHSRHELLAAAMFVLALNFKHMTLYFAPSFFFVLLGRHFVLRKPLSSIVRIGMIGVAVIGTFLLLWAPFLLNGTALNVLTRLFPVSRGLFEDKVANLWCSTAPLFRFKERFSSEMLFRFAAIATLVAMTPSCFMLFRRPSIRMFLLSLANVSLAFFLLAFQVHEKNILMPLLPLSLLWNNHRHLVTCATTVACFSMFPLLERDGLAIQYFCFMIALAVLSLRIGSFKTTFVPTWLPIITTHILLAFVAPPAKLPHLYIMICMLISFLHFSFIFIYLLWLQLVESRKVDKME
jgi:alpha-1,3-glucosyltransferase